MKKSLHVSCPYCMGEYPDRLTCSECYGEGKMMTEAERHIQNAEVTLMVNCERSFVNDTFRGLLDEIKRLQKTHANRWQPIETAPGVDGDVHMRGLFVANNKTKETRFDIYIGYIAENGDFEDEHTGDGVGWHPEDFDYWMPKPKSPTLKGDDT